MHEINQRSADRLLNGCLANGGLYIKIGQGVSAMNHILPREYTDTLKKLEVKSPISESYFYCNQFLHIFQGSMLATQRRRSEEIIFRRIW